MAVAEKTYLQAISDGLRQEMRHDKRVFLIGEDIGVYGGAFKVTAGFLEEFGSWRVIDAPLSETAIVGGATGAAMAGLRPVAEMQFADFISCAYDHLVTIAAKQHWRAGTPCRSRCGCPSGGGFSGGPFHSQNPESTFAHFPGLKCVCPATPADAKGLIVSAIEDPNPVLFFEHKHLYRRIKGEVPDERYSTPIGEARIHQEGDDVTIVTWGAMVYTRRGGGGRGRRTTCRSRSSTCARVLPWDKEAVLASVRKTSKVIVLHEDTLTGGFGAEIAATIAEEAFEDLDAPPKRIAAPDTPVPFAPVLEQAFLPQVSDVVAGAPRGRRSTDGDRHRSSTSSCPRWACRCRRGRSPAGSGASATRSRADEPLLEISTDKVDTEVPSPGSGVLQEILVQEGETVAVGTVLARIGPGEPRRPGAAAPRAAAAARASRRRSPLPRSPRLRRRPCRRSRSWPSRSRGARAGARRRTAPRRRRHTFVSPVVARIAAEHGIDPSTVPGTGRDGRVTKKDILAFVEAGAAPRPLSPRCSGARSAPRPLPPRRPRLAARCAQPAARPAPPAPP